MKKFFKNIDEKIGVIMMVVVLAITFFNVLSRYCLHASFSFADELSSVLFVLIALIGSAISVKEDGHFTLDILVNGLPVKTQRIVRLIASFLSLILCVVITYLGVKMVIQQYGIGTISTSMHIPQWMYGLTVPVGMLCITIRYIQKLISSVKELVKGDNEQ